MGDGLNSAQSEAEVIQPVEAVPAEAEEQTPAQGQNTEEPEVYVEGEGDQEPPKGMPPERTYAAWKKEKSKRKEKAEQVKQLEEKNRVLEERLKSIESKVTEVSKGPRPNPYDYSDQDEFYKALDEWNSSGNVEAPVNTPEQPQQAANVSLSDEQDYYLYTSEASLKERLPDYDQAKERAVSTLQEAFPHIPNVADGLVQEAHTFGVDPAKVFVALDKLPGKAQELAMAASNPNRAILRQVMQDLESKVKVREKVKADTKPEPTINSNGPVNPHSEEMRIAQKKYEENPSLENHKVLQRIRKRAKANKG